MATIFFDEIIEETMEIENLHSPVMQKEVMEYL